MSLDSSIAVNLTTPIDPDPKSIPPETRPKNCCQNWLASRCFKYTKLVLIIIYALNVVAWGGMLFLILVGAANQTITNEHERRVWIEIDSQILNALFCVTGIGLIPWRVRDVIQLYSKKYQPRLLRRHVYTKNIRWIRLVVWLFILNSLLQIGMAVCMWSLDMDRRPGWLVGIFVGLGCLTGIIAGLAQLILGKKLKKRLRIEQEKAGVLVSP